jgi:DUF4097 and DUF4098 domain-containing protein YvlB
MTNFQTPAPIAAVVDIPAGRIQLIAADRADTSVEVRALDASKSRDVKAAEQTEVSFAEGVLRVSVAARNQILGAPGSIEVTVQLPAGSSAEVKAASASLRVVGRLGSVAFEGAQSEIKIDEASGARVTTSAGDVSIGRLTGPAEITTAKGDIRIGEASRGRVVLSTQAGDLSVFAAAGVPATLDAGTTHGRVHNALKNSVGADAELQVVASTAYGDISAQSL